MVMTLSFLQDLGAVQQEAEDLGQVVSSQEGATSTEQVIMESADATLAAVKIIPTTS